MFKRIHLLVLDSVGIGEAPDSADFGDFDVDTLGHIVLVCGGLKMPNMRKLGIGNIRNIPGFEPVVRPLAYYGKMRQTSNGKDTMTGHWEMMGLYMDKPLNVFPEGFPLELIQRIENYAGRKVIGNKPASGTEIIQELGGEHLKTGALIVYTSADSVLQIAAHEEVIPLQELYRICEFCREITLDSRYMLGRIIARPFIGNLGSFTRTANRHDYALKPFGRTVMNELKDAGYEIVALGKISDIYVGEGITKTAGSVSNMDGLDKFTAVFDEDFTGLSFLNLGDFDTLYGHRRDPQGYGRALEEYDTRLPEIFAKLTDNDLLIITADHGNDPTYSGSDHTREYVPLLVYSPRFSGGGSELAERVTFADIGATIAENFQVKMPEYGTSFLRELK